MSEEKKHFWHQITADIGRTPVVSRFTSRTLHHLDQGLLQLTGGNHSVSSVLTGVPTLILTTTGAKSGLSRSVPLVGIQNGERIGLIASNWGGRSNPGWFYNLMANPKATVKVGGEENLFLAAEAVGEEYARFWQMALDVYPGYADYKQRAAHRKIHIMVLEPVEG